MRVMTLLRILLMFFVAGLIYINVLQGNTIAMQRNLIRTILRNPNCLVDQ